MKEDTAVPFRVEALGYGLQCGQCPLPRLVLEGLPCQQWLRRKESADMRRRVKGGKQQCAPQKLVAHGRLRVRGSHK